MMLDWKVKRLVFMSVTAVGSLQFTVVLDITLPEDPEEFQQRKHELMENSSREVEP